MNPYQKIISCVESELKELDENLSKVLKEKENELTFKLEKYIFSKSKRIRSALVFMLSKALFEKVSNEQLKVASATEIIHNATLVHDDIIDDSDLRRGEITVNYEFDNSLAVVAGDFLLSLALEELLSIDNREVIRIFTNSLTQVCMGEIRQYFDKNKILSIEEYIKKSRQKTAMLFEASLLSVSVLNQNKFKDKIQNFASNFGIAFQIRDDLINIVKIEDLKPIYNDIQNGIYTAPLIYLFEENPELVNSPIETMVSAFESSGAIEKTKKLIQNHISLAIDSLDFINDNFYKQSIINLCTYISEVE